MQISSGPKITLATPVQPAHANIALVALNWFIIALPLLMIIVGIILLAKHKTVAGAIVLALAIPLPIILFVIASMLNTSIW